MFKKLLRLLSAAEEILFGEEEENNRSEGKEPESAGAAPKQDNVLMHPRYWVVSNYDRVDFQKNPTMKTMAQRGLKNGEIANIDEKIYKLSVSALFDTLVKHFKQELPRDHGKWTIQIEDNHILINVQLERMDAWTDMTRAWSTAKENVGIQGVIMPDSQESWDRVELQANIKIPIANIQLNGESPLIWNLLQSNRERPIVWDGALWIPKLKSE